LHDEWYFTRDAAITKWISERRWLFQATFISF